MNELLALIGLSWSRLLLYPGGLAALAMLWLWRRMAGAESSRPGIVPAAVAALPPLLLISLLPLPGAARLMRQIDLPLALALLEWPQALALPPLLALREPAGRGERRLAELKLGYGLLLLSALALAQATRSLNLDGLLRETSEPLPRVLLLAGAIGWALALPPLLAVWPFPRHPQADPETWGDGLRTVGHILLATLPWLPLLGSPLLLPLPPLLLALLLATARRWGRSQHPAGTYTLAFLAGTLAALLALVAWAAVAERLL